MPGATVNDVDRRHGLPANRISSWRTLARKGRLVFCRRRRIRSNSRP
ncbi:hypothetical protein [Falsirhodobacter halotolerans]